MISVIIPAYNEKEHLKRLLPYLKTIMGDDSHEVIVALSQNNSDPDEDPFLREDRVTMRVPGHGRAVQMNHGARHARGTALAFLHADVLPPDTFFSDIEKTLGRGYEAGFFSYHFDKPHWLLKINASFTSKNGIFTGGGDQCLFIRKSVFDEMGGFDESQVLMEDFEFFSRLKKRKIPYKIVNNDLIVSARKYRYNSYFRVNLSNLLLFVLFRVGYPPDKLKTLYSRLLRRVNG